MFLIVLRGSSRVQLISYDCSSEILWWYKRESLSTSPLIMQLSWSEQRSRNVSPLWACYDALLSTLRRLCLRHFVGCLHAQDRCRKTCVFALAALRPVPTLHCAPRRHDQMFASARVPAELVGMQICCWRDSRSALRLLRFRSSRRWVMVVSLHFQRHRLQLSSMSARCHYSRGSIIGPLLASDTSRTSYD